MESKIGRKRDKNNIKGVQAEKFQVTKNIKKVKNTLKTKDLIKKRKKRKRRSRRRRKKGRRRSRYIPPYREDIMA